MNSSAVPNDSALSMNASQSLHSSNNGSYGSSPPSRSNPRDAKNGQNTSNVHTTISQPLINQNKASADTIRLLSSLQLFHSDLPSVTSSQLCRHLLKHCSILRIPSGTTVFRRQTPVEYVYALIQGHIELIQYEKVGDWTMEATGKMEEDIFKNKQERTLGAYHNNDTHNHQEDKNHNDSKNDTKHNNTHTHNSNSNEHNNQDHKTNQPKLQYNMLNTSITPNKKHSQTHNYYPSQPLLEGLVNACVNVISNVGKHLKAKHKKNKAFEVIQPWLNTIIQSQVSNMQNKKNNSHLQSNNSPNTVGPNNISPNKNSRSKTSLRSNLNQRQEILLTTKPIPQIIISNRQQINNTQCFINLSDALNDLHSLSCIAIDTCTVVRFPVLQLLQAFQGQSHRRLQELSSQFRKITVFSMLSKDKLNQIILSAQQMPAVKKGQYLYKENQQTNGFYLLINGEVKITRRVELNRENPNLLYMNRSTMHTYQPLTTAFLSSSLVRHLTSSMNPAAMLNPVNTTVVKLENSAVSGIIGASNMVSKILPKFVGTLPVPTHHNKSANHPNTNHPPVQSVSPYSFHPLPYSDLSNLYNYTPKYKTVQICVISGTTLVGQQQFIKQTRRHVSAQIVSQTAQLFKISQKYLETILASNDNSVANKSVKNSQNNYNINNKTNNNNNNINNINKHNGNSINSYSQFIMTLYHTLTKNKILFRQEKLSNILSLENKTNMDYFYIDREVEREDLGSTRNNITMQNNNHIGNNNGKNINNLISPTNSNISSKLNNTISNLSNNNSPNHSKSHRKRTNSHNPALQVYRDGAILPFNHQTNTYQPIYTTNRILGGSNNHPNEGYIYPPTYTHFNFHQMGNKAHRKASLNVVPATDRMNITAFNSSTINHSHQNNQLVTTNPNNNTNNNKSNYPQQSLNVSRFTSQQSRIVQLTHANQVMAQKIKAKQIIGKKIGVKQQSVMQGQKVEG